MDIEEELLQMNSFQRENPNIHKLLLTCITTHRFGAFKNLLKRSHESKYLSIDLDYIYPHPLSKSLLDISCCEGLPEFVEIILEFGANPNKLNVAHNRGPIHFATELGHVNILRVLLKDERTNPNLEAGRETALHFAVRKNYIECVKVLLFNNASPNIPNAKGITPIYIAASASQKEMVIVLLNSSKLAPDLDNFWDFRKITPRNMIENKLPDIKLPPQMKQQIDFNILRFYLDANDEEHFLDNLKKINDEDDGINILCESKLLVIAVGKNFYNSVKELMRRLKNSEENYLDIVDATKMAIKCGHPDILAELFQCNYLKITDEMLIISCQQLGIVSIQSTNEQSNRLKCLKMILEEANVNVRCEDEKGNTPLHYAVRAENTDAINILLKYGSYLGHNNILGVTPLAHISPVILEKYFDNCVNSNNYGTDDYEINFDYTCLLPHKWTIEESLDCSIDEENTVNDPLSNNLSNNTPLKLEMDAIQYIASNKSLKNLLKHPLLSSYLYLKWYRIRQFLYINTIFYILFYIFLNFYILMIAYKIDGISERFDLNINNTNNTAQFEKILKIASEMRGMWLILSVLFILLFVRELCQFITSPVSYIMSFENWLEVLLIILTGAILSGAGGSVGAVAILLSAWELVILIGQHPRMSTGIEMFKTVSTNLTVFLLPYAFLIVAFAMAFFTLFKDGDESNFPDPGHSLFKTIIMLTGEFDADSIPFISHPFLSHIIFVMFVFLIAIVLFNLLIGLAVSDTGDILNKSELVGLISRTKLICYTERMIMGSSFINLLKFWKKSNQNGMNMLVKRIILFPYRKIGVKIYKGYEINFCRSNVKLRNCTNLKMDSGIVVKAKEIISARGRMTENEKIMRELENINTNLKRIDDIVDNINKTFQQNS